MLFHRCPANILAVNTCMRHLKPLQFIGLVFADTAWLSKSSVCAHKHRSFWRQGNAYRADTHHTHREKRRREGRIEFIFLCFSFSLAVYLLQSLLPLNTSRHSEIILFFSTSTVATHVGICVESCHSKPFSRVFANNL